MRDAQFQSSRFFKVDVCVNTYVRTYKVCIDTVPIVNKTYVTARFVKIWSMVIMYHFVDVNIISLV